MEQERRGNVLELLWNLLLTRGDFIRAVQRMLVRQGSKTIFFKIGPKRLVLTIDPGLAHQTLVEGAHAHPKTSWEERVLKPAMEGGLIISRGEQWKTHRQALASCFGAHPMTALAEMTCDAARSRMSRWERVVDLGHEMRCIVNDVMFRFFFEGHELDKDPEVKGGIDRLSHDFTTVEHGLEKRVLDPLWFAEPVKHVLRLERHFREAIVRVTARIRAVFTRHRGCPVSHDHSALQTLLQRLPSDDAVVHEIRTTIAAGATTGHVLTWICQLLADHPEKQERLREELASHPHTHGSVAHLEALPYLAAVVHEGLRLYPPAPFLIRKLESSPSGMIFISLWAMHRDPYCWNLPDEFVPERWLVMKEAPAAYIPFGMGARACVGKRFALLEAKVVLRELLLHFRLEPGHGDAPRPLFNILTRPKRDIVLRVSPTEGRESQNPAA